jgi:L-ascorbate metabolism protein UlaG (beta-lactamase superfamily)
MLIIYHGHSEFLLETEGGLRILTDPFDPKVPYPYRETSADIVTVSHEHFDHNHTEKVKGSPTVVRGVASFCPAPGVTVTGYPSFHDDKQGALRGPNTIFVIETEGLRVAHLGDLGAFPDKEVINALRGADVLMIPIGGTYTLDAERGAAFTRLIKPRVTIPMHYKEGPRGLQNIDPADIFLNALAPVMPARQPLLRVTTEDISEAPGLVLLEVV